MDLIHAFLCIVLLASRCAGDGGQATAASHSAGDHLHRSWTCPDPDVIFPCVCSSDESLDCSRVESEEQLAQIMASPFPYPDFFMLTIHFNDKLKVLRAGVLANTTYNWIYITNNVLEVVETGALSGSYSTALWIEMTDNRISSFPWEEVSSFTRLEDLLLYRNNISEFSGFKSDTLKALMLLSNPIGSVTATVFNDMPELRSINLEETGLMDIIPGTFVGVPKLCYLSLQDNHLVHLPEGAIKLFSECRTATVTLYKNNISSVAVNAISGFPYGGTIYLWHNQLTVLEEEVWRPLLQNDVKLKLKSNPLLCGCDIAWIVLNPTYLSLIEDTTECSTGELLVDLDPAIFQQC